jgi:hypothetical protein
METICKICKTPFITTDGKRKYCSRQCAKLKIKTDCKLRMRKKFLALTREERQQRYHMNSRERPLRNQRRYDRLKHEHWCLHCGRNILHLGVHCRYCENCNTPKKRKKTQTTLD